jgi:hypothetical protein
MTEQHQWIFRCVRSGHRVHLILDGGFPRPKSTNSQFLYPRHSDPDRKLPRLEREHHGQFNELKLDVHELDFHKADLYRTSTNCSHKCQRWRVKRCSVARSDRTGRCIWPTGWLRLWSDFITMERNGCRHRRSHHWRSPLLTLMITWTTVPSFLV